MKSLFTLRLTIIALSALTISLTSSSCKKDKWPNCVKANGKIETETRTLDKFTEIELEGSGDVYLYQINDENSYTVEIETSKNVMDRVETKIKGNKLTLSSKCIRGKSDIKYTVRVADLSKVSISGSGTVTTLTKFNLDKLNLNVSGSGHMDFETTATDVTCDISGSGKMDLSGSTDILDVNVTGSGDIHAFNFPTTDCFVDISGSGNCDVFVNGNLTVNISGSGDVVYDGTPTGFNSNASGSGSVSKR